MTKNTEPMNSENEGKKTQFGNIWIWVMGALSTAISVLWLSTKDDKDFLRQQLKEANERASKAEGLLKECYDGRTERAEKAADWARDHIKTDKE